MFSSSVGIVMTSINVFAFVHFHGHNEDMWKVEKCLSRSGVSCSRADTNPALVTYCFVASLSPLLHCYRVVLYQRRRSLEHSWDHPAEGRTRQCTVAAAHNLLYIKIWQTHYARERIIIILQERQYLWTRSVLSYPFHHFIIPAESIVDLTACQHEYLEKS
jgi:hypothetical protein